MNYIPTPDELLKRLSAQNGGSIVCSGSCNELEIACAQADRSGRFYVDERGIGYVLRPETEKTARQIRADERRKVLEEFQSTPPREGQLANQMLKAALTPEDREWTDAPMGPMKGQGEPWPRLPARHSDPIRDDLRACPQYHWRVFVVEEFARWRQLFGIEEQKETKG